MFSAIALKIKNTEMEEVKVQLICGKISSKSREWICTTDHKPISFNPETEDASVNF